MMIRCMFLSLYFVSINSVSLPVSNITRTPPLLLLVSFDGFRWDYPDMYQLTYFNSLVKRGVKAKHIENSFATVTFPSHFTIATGFYEETHGIVANTIFDPTFNEAVNIKVANDSKWWSQNSQSQPIWISNQLANDSTQRRSGVIAWPGSNVLINGQLPFKHEPYRSNRTFDDILGDILKWFLDSHGESINFGAIYYQEPDETGHGFGPISPEMNQTLRKCDDYLRRLLEKIDQNEYLKNNLNVIITSDHGMHSVDQKHVIKLEDYIDKSLFSAYGGGAFSNIFVKNKSDIDRIYSNLSSIPYFKVFKKSEIPEEFHYRSNVRIGDILIVGQVGSEIISVDDDVSHVSRGDHGYDNRVESMHPIFYGFGPAFRQNLISKPFRNVDIYSLMSYILHLNQRQTNGSLDNVKHLLMDFPQTDNFSIIIVIICSIFTFLFAIIFTIWSCRHASHSIYIEPPSTTVQYSLLQNNEATSQDDAVSESEDSDQTI